MVETQLRKLRGTSDTFVGRAYSIFHLQNMVYKNISCEYDQWVVETQLCKLRDTSDTLIGHACAMFQLKYGVCELHLR